MRVTVSRKQNVGSQMATPTPTRFRRSKLPEQLDDDGCLDDQFTGVIPRLLCLRGEERVKSEPDISEVGLR
jgi:hypothetical protein